MNNANKGWFAKVEASPKHARARPPACRTDVCEL